MHLRVALLALILASPVLAEPVLHCDPAGCAWVEEIDPAPGVSLYEEQRSTRSIPAELWMPTPRVEAAPTVVQPAPSVVYLRDHRRHGDPVWKQACRARGAYPSACLPDAYGRSWRHGSGYLPRKGRHPRRDARLVPAPREQWPRGIRVGPGRERRGE